MKETKPEEPKLAEPKGGAPRATKMSPLERLNNIVGYDVTKSVRPTKGAIAKVMEKIAEERLLKAEEASEKLIREAVKLGEEKGTCDRAYAKASKEWDDKLGKLLSQIESGGPPETEVEESK